MDILFCFVLRLSYIRKCICKSIWKAITDQGTWNIWDGALLTEVGCWKLFTIAVEAFVLDVV